jgi:hypothetical protein
MGTAFSATTTSKDKNTFDDDFCGATLSRIWEQSKFECNVSTVLRVPKSHFTIDSKKLELAMDIAICKLPARGR